MHAAAAPTAPCVPAPDVDGEAAVTEPVFQVIGDGEKFNVDTAGDAFWIGLSSHYDIPIAIPAKTVCLSLGLLAGVAVRRVANALGL